MMNMNKKEYIAPECFVVEMETVSMIATSNDRPIAPGEDDEIELNSNRHRGEWGNLWGRGE